MAAASRSSTCARCPRWTSTRSPPRCARPAAASSRTRRRSSPGSGPRSPPRSPSGASTTWRRRCCGWAASPSRTRRPGSRITTCRTWTGSWTPSTARSATEETTMAELKEFKLPDTGEGLTEADIVAWHVKPGETVEDGQIIVEIETAKAVVELPSPWDGTVARLLAEEGQTVEVGVPIIAIQVGADTAPDHDERGGVPAPAPTASPADEEAGSAEPERHAVLVGYGVKTAATTRRVRKAPAGTAASSVATAGAAAPGAAVPGVEAARVETAATRPETAELPAAPEVTPAEPPEVPADPAVPVVRALAKPPVRKLAKDLGIDLAALAGGGSGPDGSITRDDVQRAATTGTQPRSVHSENGGRAATSATAPSTPWPGGEERIPVRGVRKHMAAAMVSSAFSAPPAPDFLRV